MNLLLYVGECWKETEKWIKRILLVFIAESFRGWLLSFLHENPICNVAVSYKVSFLQTSKKKEKWLFVHEFVSWRNILAAFWFL